jgi:hypothetical protein
MVQWERTHVSSPAVCVKVPSDCQGMVATWAVVPTIKTLNTARQRADVVVRVPVGDRQTWRGMWCPCWLWLWFGNFGDW